MIKLICYKVTFLLFYAFLENNLSPWKKFLLPWKTACHQACSHDIYNYDTVNGVKSKPLSLVWHWHYGLYSPWNSPGQNTGVGNLSLLQGIFSTQRLNPGLLHHRWVLYQLRHKEAHTKGKTFVYQAFVNYLGLRSRRVWPFF